MITLASVHKTYLGGPPWKRTAAHAVRGLDLEIGKGAYGLLGMNGAGKTTTLKMITSLLRPTAGKVTVCGLDTVSESRKVRSRVNMITGSDRMLYYRLTARENLRYFQALYGIGGKEGERRIGDLLSLVRLSDAADKRVETMSRGMKQRLSIARGLVNDPAVLLMDEPTLGLDVHIAREIRTFMKESLLSRPDRTLILTSHYMAEIEELCPRLGILSRGKLVFDGTVSELYLTCGLGNKHLFSLRSSSGMDPLAFETMLPFAVKGSRDENGLLLLHVRHDGDIAETVFRTARDSGCDIVDYRVEKPSLEDALVFLRETEAEAC